MPLDRTSSDPTVEALSDASAKMKGIDSFIFCSNGQDAFLLGC